MTLTTKNMKQELQIKEAECISHLWDRETLLYLEVLGVLEALEVRHTLLFLRTAFAIRMAADQYPEILITGTEGFCLFVFILFYLYMKGE